MNDDVAAEKKSNGGKNLIILGISSILIAAITSFASLYIYHASGDIYLDCSLPEANCPSARSGSEENNRKGAFVFSDSGEIDEKTLDEYLNEYQKTVNKVRKYDEPFSGDVLNNESLGI